MEQIKSIIGRVAFSLLATVVLVAPWLFGAWEVWWFWSFTAILFVSSALFGAQLLLESVHHEVHTVSGTGSSQRRRRRKTGSTDSQRRWLTVTLVACLAFLGYAALRLIQTPVFADAQRSFLLFLTPFLVGVQVVFGLTREQRRLLFKLILLNFLLLGLYGLINHAVCSSHFVLWRPGYPQYIRDSRATGTYFCPDHFAGIMEIALCLAIGVLCSRRKGWSFHIGAFVLSVIALAGVLLSKSRGAGLTTLVILGATWIWGLRAFPSRTRWILRAALPITGVALIAVATIVNEGYFKRFGAWFGWDRAKEQAFPVAMDTVWKSTQRSSRWIMLSGAMRAWGDSPLLGIGPGMHQTVWPHVAASGDGDIEQGVWPTRLNNANYSYEVHNDWAQLLEEYGLIGLALFLVAAIGLSVSFLQGLRRVAYTTSDDSTFRNGGRTCAMTLGAWIAMLALTFHSLGDFNLQMSATTWLLAATLGLGLVEGISGPSASTTTARQT
ncbi:MAG: O-antigen ligase family protein [Kiritimatiellia bacterium]|jgi:O-antigen ligase|nr:O-antigen ligase family protein [Kiritimatiellia bacterium]MDP6811160.1 O-antigen ligase family protein [Kiritimatiellia bacterium]MDP7025283.1 O-antigen ligase family protein [Kiritimatiellia bacterium]